MASPIINYGPVMRQLGPAIKVDCQETKKAAAEPKWIRHPTMPQYEVRTVNGKLEVRSVETPATGVFIPPKTPPYQPKEFTYEHHDAAGRTTKFAPARVTWCGIDVGAVAARPEAAPEGGATHVWPSEERYSATLYYKEDLSQPAAQVAVPTLEEVAAAWRSASQRNFWGWAETWGALFVGKPYRLSNCPAEHRAAAIAAFNSIKAA